MASLLTYDTLGFACELMLACAMLMVHEHPRNHVILRGLLGILIVLGCALAGAAFLHRGWMNLVRYALIIVVTTLGLLQCFELSVKEAVFFVLAGYNIQHIYWRLGTLLMLAVPSVTPPMVFGILALPVMASTAFAFSKSLAKNRDATVNNGQLIAVVAIALVSDLVLSYLPILSDGGFGSLSATESLYAIICCVLILVIQSGILTRSRLEWEQGLLQELWKAKDSQYETARKSIDVINTRSHDLKKQLNTLLAAASNEKTVSSAAIADTLKSIEAYDDTAKTGCAALDVLITQKLIEARSQHATLTYIVDGKELSRFDEVDLYALFGNILDNALESVAKITDESRRVINLRAVRRAQLLVIHCENYVDEPPIQDENGLFQTKKANPENHGFGLQSVDMVVKRYGGNMTVSADDGVFHLRVVLPLS